MIHSDPVGNQIKEWANHLRTAGHDHDPWPRMQRAWPSQDLGVGHGRSVLPGRLHLLVEGLLQLPLHVLETLYEFLRPLRLLRLQSHGFLRLLLLPNLVCLPRGLQPLVERLRGLARGR